MIVEFSLGNFRSFNEMQTLQFQAARIRSRFPELDRSNVAVVDDELSLLKSKAIFGANGSGKSNVAKGLIAMLIAIRDCLKDPETLSKTMEPFRLNPASIRQPSFFQLNFLLENTQYRYGFEADAEKVYTEWLFAKPVGKKSVRERYFFLREAQDIKINETHFKEGSRLVKKEEGTPLFKENTLFLSVLAAFNSPLSLKIMQYFREDILIVSGLDDVRLKDYSMQRMEKDERFRQKVTALMQVIDPGILRIEKVEMDVHLPDNASEQDQLLLETISKRGSIGDLAIFRRQYDESGKPAGEIPLLLSPHEAAGTKKLFNLTAFLFDALEQGKFLLIDEFDARMHPLLTRKIIEQFQGERTNPKQAQLVFITHDVNLLDARLLRRDQIAFTRKDRFGQSELYSLVEFKGVRNDASFEKDYLLGKYDAVPANLNAFEEAVEEYLRKGDEKAD